MREPIFDPTAGERARRIQNRAIGPLQIMDPTDPRCGTVVREVAEPAGELSRVPARSSSIRVETAGARSAGDSRGG